jgi:hypothetical protein
MEMFLESDSGAYSEGDCEEMLGDETALQWQQEPGLTEARAVSNWMQQPCVPAYRWSVWNEESQGSSVSIVFDYGLDGRGLIPDRGRALFLKPLRPDQRWVPPSLLYNGYRGLFPQGWSAAGAWCWPPAPF